MILSGDVMNVRGIQHPRQGNSVFWFRQRFFPRQVGTDSFSLTEEKRLAAQQEQRPVRNLSNYDYLAGIEDLTRMGGIRYSTKKNGAFINSNSRCSVPPLENLGALCDACQNIEIGLKNAMNFLSSVGWTNLLIRLLHFGGARPKANVMDTDGRLYVC